MKKYPALVLLALLTFAALPASAAHLGETVHVNALGLVCEYCAQSIKKVFLRTEEIETIEVDLDAALITIVMKPGRIFTDEAIRHHIEEAGYNVDQIHHMPAEPHG